MTESVIMKKIRQAVNLDGRARLIRNNVGFWKEQKIVFGLGRGSADLVGMLKGSGRVLVIEVKTPVGKLTREQSLWLAAVRRLGGFAAVARSVDEALVAVSRACDGESE